MCHRNDADIAAIDDEASARSGATGRARPRADRALLLADAERLENLDYA
jgi:hypothetical protein